MFSRVILFSGMQRCFSKILPNPTKLPPPQGAKPLIPGACHTSLLGTKAHILGTGTRTHHPYKTTLPHRIPHNLRGAGSPETNN
jgi:hypothetical protein